MRIGLVPHQLPPFIQSRNQAKDDYNNNTMNLIYRIKSLSQKHSYLQETFITNTVLLSKFDKETRQKITDKETFQEWTKEENDKLPNDFNN